jgi:hypothetical protein
MQVMTLLNTVEYKNRSWLTLKILSRVEATKDGVLDWMIRFIAPYAFTSRDYR